MKTNEILENIKARRSVRAYTGQQVSGRGFAGCSGGCYLCAEREHLETWHFTAFRMADKLT